MAIIPHVVDPNLDIEVVCDAPVSPHEVFAAWTDASTYGAWFCPRPYSTGACSIDLRPGGAFHMVIVDPEGNVAEIGTGCVLDVVPDERFVWTAALTTGFRPQFSPIPFTAILEFSPNGSGGCRYRAIGVHQDVEGANQHREMGFVDGWTAAFNQLVEYLRPGV